MCCFVPFVRWLSGHLGPEEGLIAIVIFTEIVRWIMVAIPTALTVWRYGELVGYTRFIPGMEEKLQYWIIAGAIFMAASLLIYLPVKILCSMFWKDARYNYGWRPSMVVYITLCAFPCLTTLLIAIIKSRGNHNMIDEATTMVIQGLVMALTVTEWMAKFRDEVMTFDLVNAMATDFFFAYDVIDFFMLPAYSQGIYNSYWLHVTFVLGFIAMIKYIPAQPTEMIDENGTPKGAVTCILVSMFCNDVPFVVVRFITMAQFGLKASDIIHPAKNVAMIFFGCTQLYIIYHNYRTRRKAEKDKFLERRCARHSKKSKDNVDTGENDNKRVSGYSNSECTCEDVEETSFRGEPIHLSVNHKIAPI